MLLSSGRGVLTVVIGSEALFEIVDLAERAGNDAGLLELVDGRLDAALLLDGIGDASGDGGACETDSERKKELFHGNSLNALRGIAKRRSYTPITVFLQWRKTIFSAYESFRFSLQQ